MTNLEKLVQATVDRTLAIRFDAATEKVADEMAKEIINDPTWRAEMQHLIRAAFGRTVTTLNSQVRKPKRRIRAPAAAGRRRRPRR